MLMIIIKHGICKYCIMVYILLLYFCWQSFSSTVIVLASFVPDLCPLRPSSGRSMEPSLSWAWRWCSSAGRICLSMELFRSSGPHKGPDKGVRSREEAFLSVGGTMLFTLRAPWMRPCPWLGGGSGGGGRSAPIKPMANRDEHICDI